jgi:hypothetical protein
MLAIKQLERAADLSEAVGSVESSQPVRTS